MSGLKIYGIAQSRTSRVLWAANEAGVAYEHIPVDFKDDSNLKPEFRAISPSGHIPVIDDNGFVLRESMAITLYLAKKHSTGRLYPADPQGEALALQWTLFGASSLEPNLRGWPAEMALPAADTRERDALNQNPLTVMARTLEVLNGALADRPYLLGKEFTIADLNVASTLNRARDRNFGASTRVPEWLHRCLDRPASVAARK